MRPLLKYFILVLSALVVFTVLLLDTIVDKIVNDSLTDLNQSIHGQLNYTSLSFDLFTAFPNCTVELQEVSLIDESNPNRDTILQLKTLSTSFNTVKLFSGELELVKSRVRGGKLRLVKSKKGSINLEKSIRRKDTSNQRQKQELAFELDGILIEDLDLTYVDSLGGRQLDLTIDSLGVALSHQTDSINSFIKAKTKLEQYNKSPWFIENRKLDIDLNLCYRKEETQFVFKESSISLDRLQLEFSGDWTPSPSKELDIRFSANSQTGILDLILSNQAIDNIQAGSSELSGRISGSYKEGLPQIELDLKAENISIDLNKSGRKITDLSFKAALNTGIQADLSDAEFNLNYLTAQLPQGSLEANMAVKNFERPFLQYHLDLKTDLDGLDQLFRFKTIRDLKGELRIEESFKGNYNDSLSFMQSNTSHSDIKLQNLSFTLDSLSQIDSLNAELYREGQKLIVKELSIRTPHSRLQINGSINSFLDVLLSKQNEVFSNWTIQADSLDIPNEFKWVPGLANALPFQLHQMRFETDLFARNNTIDKKQRKEILGANIRDFQSNVKGIQTTYNIKKVKLQAYYQEYDLGLDFSALEAFADQGQINGDVIILIKDSSTTELFYKGNFNGLQPSAFIPSQYDSIAKQFSGLLYGPISSQLFFERDSFDISHLELRSDKLVYDEDDTLTLENLELIADSIYFGPPLAELSFQSDISVSHISNKVLNVRDQHFNLEAKAGHFELDINQLRLFGKQGNGNFTFSPFSEEPNYRLKCEVLDFDAEDLLKGFNQAPFMQGKMDLLLDININTTSKENIAKSLDGHFTLKGDSLEVIGVDLDKFLKKYNRTQKFDLLDVGAFALAGPIGLAFTKGTDFASLAVGSKGELTQIVKLNSEFHVSKGRIELDDVAFSTPKNRIAGQGCIDLDRNRAELVFAVLDQMGCAVIEQDIYGSLSNLEKSDVKVLGTLMGPVTNLFKNKSGNNCKVFYDGKVIHPIK